MSDSELAPISLQNLQFAAMFMCINSQDDLIDQEGVHTAEERRTQARHGGHKLYHRRERQRLIHRDAQAIAISLRGFGRRVINLCLLKKDFHHMERERLESAI